MEIPIQSKNLEEMPECKRDIQMNILINFPMQGLWWDVVVINSSDHKLSKKAFARHSLRILCLYITKFTSKGKPLYLYSWCMDRQTISKKLFFHDNLQTRIMIISVEVG